MDYETRKLVDALIDRSMYDHDAMYHMQVEQFRRWLVMTEHAMRDEGCTPLQVTKVLNRLVYGHPSGADAYERIDTKNWLAKQAGISKIDQAWVDRLLDSSTGKQGQWPNQPPANVGDHSGQRSTHGNPAAPGSAEAEGPGDSGLAG